MHEAYLAERALGFIEDYSRREGVRSVSRIVFTLGKWSCVSQEAFAWVFALAAKDTPADGAALHFEATEPRGHCRQCGGEVAPRGERKAPCPSCRAPDVQWDRGWEFGIRELEVEYV